MVLRFLIAFVFCFVVRPSSAAFVPLDQSHIISATEKALAEARAEAGGNSNSFDEIETALSDSTAAERFAESVTGKVLDTFRRQRLKQQQQQHAADVRASKS